jgi:hypothetical protein
VPLESVGRACGYFPVVAALLRSRPSSLIFHEGLPNFLRSADDPFDILAHLDDRLPVAGGDVLSVGEVVAQAFQHFEHLFCLPAGFHPDQASEFFIAGYDLPFIRHLKTIH